MDNSVKQAASDFLKKIVCVRLTFLTFEDALILIIIYTHCNL